MSKLNPEAKVVKHWEWTISPTSSWLGIRFKELLTHKDLLLSLTRKEFLATYQQTLLGPLWVIFQPLLTVITYVFVFNKLIGVTTEGVPPLLFNLVGITLWNFFSEIFFSVSRTYTANAQIFNKVYFPRIIVPLASLGLQLILFSIQLILLTVFVIYFLLTDRIDLKYVNLLAIVPSIILTAGIAFGSGLIVAVITAKYRDLVSILQLVIRLLMFMSPVFFALSIVPENIRWVVELNPLTSLFEVFRFSILGTTAVGFGQLLYSFIAMVLLSVSGILVFNKMSDKLIDVL